ncbi:hypothetical protein JEY40_38515 [Bradyrhizobium japonicum]|uniref:hypothetical protein n=1 Tax=Bradyrhizobium japonicum TaxID=375 RepID=UPI00200CB462|nr:hypothetical protein [Bradyrhizobium japonicum]UQD71654.1 hypothetical protein JEY40_38515 [Bradyrhizobium japonicum]WLB55909.1 hypothetical protein QIH94_07955 [Bradyrhizobium japonicum]WLB62198.1 hypothetical protein QIH96_37855 [Bradyrhizobium japonicum]
MKEGEFRDGEALPPVLFYWRTKTAESFDERARSEVASFVAGISATMPEWRAVIRGDAAAAIGIVIGRRIPERIGLRVDLSMTVLLACALFDPAAAMVLSHTLARMPIETRERTRLSASWSMHEIWLGSRRAGARVPKTPPRLTGGGS